MTQHIQPLTDLDENITKMENLLQKLTMGLAQTAVKLHSYGGKPPVDVDNLIAQTDTQKQILKKSSRKVSRQLGQMQEFVRTSALITSSLELNKVLEDVMDTVIQLTGAERAFLMLKSGDDDLKVHAARDWDKESLSEGEISFSRGIINSAMAQGKPLITTNAQEDARFSDMASVVSNDLRSIIVIPLVWQDKAQGVLYVDNRLMMGVFQQDTIPLLTAFANQAAIAIANARLFERVKDDLAQAQREVQRLRIRVDDKSVQEQVEEITDNDYFQNLASMARNLRRRDEK